MLFLYVRFGFLQFSCSSYFLFSLHQGDNGRIEYTITSGDDNSDFEIFSNGTIRTQRTLDRETKSSYNLIVTARDCAKEFPMMYDDHNEHDNEVIAANDARLNQYQSMPYSLQRQRRQYLQYQQQLQLQQLQQQQQLQYGDAVQGSQQRLSATVQVRFDEIFCFLHFPLKILFYKTLF